MVCPDRLPLRPHLLVSAMSFLLTLCTLVVFACFGRVCLAQDDTFIQMLLSYLDSLQLTNFTSVVRQVQADPTQTTFFTTISDSSTPKTLFVPNNDACAIFLLSAYLILLL